MIYHDDCLNILPSIETNSVDFILTDPPYEIGKYSTGNIKLPNRKALNNDIAHWDQDFSPEKYADELIRVLKPSGNMFIFSSYNMIGKWHDLLDSKFDTFQYFIWHKTNPPPKIFKNGFLNSCEMIVCVWNKKHTWNFSNQKEMHNYFESPICMGKERLKHPTQKPLKLIRHLIEIGSNPDDLILDPFGGVGTTYVAAKSLGRRAITIEKEFEYHKLALNRIQSLINLS